MAGSSPNPAQLGADNVIRFVDADHFLEELAGNLGRGRAFVRSRRHFELRAALAVEIEAPGVPRRIPATAIVVYARDGSVGLEFEDFESELLPRLDRLGQAVEAGQRPPAQEATIIGPLPGSETDDLPRVSQGEAIVHITEEDEAETGSFPVLRIEPGESIEETFRAPSRRPPPRDETLLSEPPFPLNRSGGLPTRDLRHDPDPELEAGDETFDEPLPELNEPRQLRSSEEDSDDLPPPPREGSMLRLNPLLNPAGTVEVPSEAPEPNTAGDASAQVEPESAEPVVSEAPVAPPEGAQAEASPEAVAEPEPAPEPEAEPARLEAEPPPPAPPAPPQPTVPLARPEALEDKVWPLPRMTRGGVLRVTDPGDLLGRFLAEIRHGGLTVYGGPEGEPGDSVGIKIAGQRVVSLDAEIVARIGPFLTLKVPPEAIAELLGESREALRGLLSELGFVPPPAPVEEAPVPDPEPGPVEPEEPPATIDLRPRAADHEAPPGSDEDQGPPETPKLVGEVVHFRRKLDLQHEIDVNLKNGGLFVESSPLPIRTKKRLKVGLAGGVTTVTLDTEVVFADGGRVGFSVGDLGDTIHRLEELLTLELGKSEDLSSPIDQDELQIRTPSAANLSAPLASFSGTLVDPPTSAELLDFQSRRIEHASATSQSSSLAVFEYLSRMGGRAVLTVASGPQQRSIWLHEGSVAFVQASPYEEASGLGRILVTQKKVHESQLREALEKSKMTGKSLGRVMVLLGLIKKSDLSVAIREQSRLRVQAAFEWKRGNFEVSEWSEPPGDADLVLTKGLTVLGRYLRDRFEGLGIPELEALFGKNLGRAVAPTISLESASSSLALQPKEMRFLELQLDGSKSIHDACLGSPVGRLASLRLVGVCVALGLVKFTDGNSRIVRNASTKVTADNAANARLRKELQDRLALVTGVNHFDVLGVHWSAHPRNYRSAYEKLKAEYASKGTYRDLPDELQKLVRQIVEAIDGAFAVLNDPNRRGLYRKQMFDQTERQYAAEMLVKQGEVALMRGDRVGAIEMLETAVELDPSQRNRSLLSTAREGRR